MSCRLGKIIFASVSFLVAISVGIYSPRLQCRDEPIGTWIEGCVIILFISSMILLLNECVTIPSALSFWFVTVIIPISFIGILSWITLGAIWLIKNLSSPHQCLPLGIYVILLWSICTIAVSLIIIAGITFINFVRHKVESLEAKRAKDKLLMLYNNKEYAKKTEYDCFIHKVWVILEAQTILDIEKKLINEHCSYTVKEKEDDVCNICLGEFEQGDIKSNISCKHFYHYECIIKWLEIRPICPCCRTHFRLKLIKLYCNSDKSDIECNDKTHLTHEI